MCGNRVVTNTVFTFYPCVGCNCCTLFLSPRGDPIYHPIFLMKLWNKFDTLSLSGNAQNNNFACCQRETSRIGDRARLGGFDNNRGDQQVAATMRMRVQVKKFYESWSKNRESIINFGSIFTQNFEPWCSFLSIQPPKMQRKFKFSPDYKTELWQMKTKFKIE